MRLTPRGEALLDLAKCTLFIIATTAGVVAWAAVAYLLQ